MSKNFIAPGGSSFYIRSRGILVEVYFTESHREFLMKVNFTEVGEFILQKATGNPAVSLFYRRSQGTLV